MIDFRLTETDKAHLDRRLTQMEAEGVRGSCLPSGRKTRRGP